MAKRREERRSAVVEGAGNGASKEKGSRSGSARSEQRRREKEQQQRRQRLILIAGVIGAIALLAAVAIIVNTLPADAPIPQGVVERYQDIPVSISDQGYPRLGDAQVARVRVSEYSSFSCPSCLSFHDDTYFELLERARAGEITFTYVPMGSFGNPGGVEAAQAAMCVAEQDPRLFWAYHDTLFAWQSQFGRQAFTLNRLRTGVEGLGLNVGQYNACMDSDRPDRIIERAEAEGRNVAGFEGTPTLTVNGVDTNAFDLTAINAAIDAALLTSGGAPQPETQTTPELTVTEDVTPEVIITEESTATEESVATEEISETEEAQETEESAP